jgi:carboxypeptidase Q
MKDDGQENVRSEKVTIRKWVRGNESCELVEPRPYKFDMLGLGGSIGTPAEGISAEVIVVDDKEELDSLADDQIAGKIVVFNKAMPMYSEIDGSGYGRTVAYRSNGAKWASERGGVAALVRSVTAYSLVSPHTGAMRYDAEVAKVPTAAISVEAALMLKRFQNRGIKTIVKLKMEAKDEGEAPSANVVAEIVGTEKPEEIVLIGGHIDSWDVGQGAQDDGAGCVAAMEALNIIRKAGLKPKRTIRVVLWTNEENGLAGARSYLARHQNENHVAGIESDSGGFKPQGLSIDLEDEDKEQIALTQLTEILQLLKPLGATRANTGYSGADVGQLKQLGTACMGLEVDGRLYFNTHHTWADTVAITLAVTAFVFADMPNRLGDESK